MSNVYINKIKEIINDPEVKVAINTKKFEKVYKIFYKNAIVTAFNAIPYLTRIFYNVGIDPLLYMEKVPEYFLINQGKISQINIPKNIKVIGRGSFAGTKIINLNIPEGVEIIEQDAFAACKFLTNVKLPSTLRVVEIRVFNGCPNIRNIEYAGKKREFQSLFYNNLESLNYKIVITCQDGKMKYRKNTKEWVDIK